MSRGLATVLVATAGLFAVSLVFASSSVTRGTLLTMLPFASALAIASLGQTLVVMQGGIDLSVAGGFSLYVVIVTKYPAGDNSRLWAAIGIAVLAAIAAGLLNGFLIGRMRLNPIVATLGNERPVVRGRALVFGRHPDNDDRSPGEGRGRDLARDPGARVLRCGHHSHCRGGRQAHAPGPSLRRGRGERDGGSYGWPRCETASVRGLPLGAAPLLPRSDSACGNRQPANGL